MRLSRLATPEVPAEAYPSGPPTHYEEGGVWYLSMPCSVEDLYRVHPHHDERIQENIRDIRTGTQFCDLLGREIAGPQQARGILRI